MKNNVKWIGKDINDLTVLNEIENPEDEEEMIVQIESEKSDAGNEMNQDIDDGDQDHLLQEKLAYLQSLDVELADIKSLQKDLDSEMDGIC